MIYLGGGTSAGMVAVSMPASDTVEMDKTQIGITPSLTLDANGVPQVSAAVSIPSGTLSSSYKTSSGSVAFSNKVTTKTITANGTYGPENGQIFNKVIVNVAGSSSGTVKAQVATATPGAATQVITPSAGYDYLSSVTINPVPLDSRNGTTITTNGTVTATDGKWFKTLTIAVPTSSGGTTTASLAEFTLSSNTESIFKDSDDKIPSKDFSIDSIIDGYTIKPPYKGNTSLSNTYDGIKYVVIPPLASWTNGNKLVDIRNFNLDDTPVDNVLSGVPYYTPTVSGLEKRTGTMVNQGAITKTFTSSNESYTIPAGYHNGAGKVSVNLQLNAYYVGSAIPSATLGNDGDIYLKLG